MSLLHVCGATEILCSTAALGCANCANRPTQPRAAVPHFEPIGKSV